MPCVIDTSHGTDDAIDLDEVIARLDESRVDFATTQAVQQGGMLLARLARNRTFLGDMILAELKAGFAGQAGNNRHSAQVLILHRSASNYYLRAAIWPAASDHLYQHSGAQQFAYDLPHDHNFSFLTVGYWGPGYVSDYYEYDAETVDGAIGEQIPLSFVSRAALTEGKVQFYRAHRDIHRQLPPDAMSISLNIMGEGEQVPWRDQYIVDLDTQTIVKRPIISPQELMLRFAVHFSGNGRDLAEQFARRHPVPRVRSHARQALAAASADLAQRAAVLAAGTADPDGRVRADCAVLLTQLEREFRPDYSRSSQGSLP